VASADGEAHQPVLSDFSPERVDGIVRELVDSMDITAGPVFRAALLDAAGESAVVLAAHPLVADLPAMDRLVEDLAVAYGQLEHGEPVVLADTGGSFRLWATSFSRWVSGPEGDEELAYWSAVSAPDDVFPTVH
jgi:hypothetical protein